MSQVELLKLLSILVIVLLEVLTFLIDIGVMVELEPPVDNTALNSLLDEFFLLSDIYNIHAAGTRTTTHENTNKPNR